MIQSNLTLLNHGSFGALPRVVFEHQNQWRARIEADPVEMLGRRGADFIDQSKQTIGAWLGMNPPDFGLVTNATEGINCVLRALTLASGDELVTTTHVYNAVRQAMKFTAQRAGAAYREIEIPVPIDSPRAIEQTILQSITPRTKLLIIDHISSPTALLFPVEAILAAFAKIGVDVLIDGAHAPGMIDLNVAKLAPAYYAGNLHKWTCAPKGAAFIWARPDRQNNLHPLIVSHHLGQGLSKEFSWQGTRDISAWLAVPRAMEFMAEFGWPRVRAHNHALAVWVNQLLCRRWSMPSLSPFDGSMLGSMTTVPLPPPLGHLNDAQSADLQRRLHDDFHIEVPIVQWSGRTHLRPCCQIYNIAEEYEQLAEVIESLL
jgi:isopenicillin-N epimerase